MIPLSVINAEYEYIALHRDIGETELKQARLTAVLHMSEAYG
jgi:hypothetical protein